MHGVFKALINGVHEKGEGGVLWVRGETCTYCFPDDFNNAEFAAGLKEMLTKPNATTLFFVVNEKDGVAHVVAYPRVNVYKQCHDELTGTTDSVIDDSPSPPLPESPVAESPAQEIRSPPPSNHSESHPPS